MLAYPFVFGDSAQSPVGLDPRFCIGLHEVVFPRRQVCLLEAPNHHMQKEFSFIVFFFFFGKVTVHTKIFRNEPCRTWGKWSAKDI